MSSTTTFDITPTPKVLALLGNIAYAPWQCIAELVDNSVDAFVSAYAAQKGYLYPEVLVTFPAKSNVANPDAAIEVQDNGPGMAPEDLEKAVKAGYSGNDPVSKLGLFGMGFNIATARLGRRTEVWTTRKDDDLWTGVAIDFDELTRKQSYQSPRLSKPKTAAERDFHGTLVRIQKLDKGKVLEALKPAGRRAIRDQLSKTYSGVIQKLGLSLKIDTDVIKPHRFCVWDATRSVTHKDLGNVATYLPIEHDFGDREYCTTCWIWLETAEVKCPTCGTQDSIRRRKRVLKGWLGVQRYFDKDDYGIDLIRNGRGIVLRSKRFFEWTDPNESRTIPEYPIDGTLGGRIVGELEMDFVPVTYQKNAFEWDTPEFKLVYDYLHGPGPILPEIAAKLGYHSDEPSPLRKLHGAYRGAYPAGLRTLIPGDSSGKVINKEPQEWAARFQSNEEEYQLDTKWYDSVLLADESLKKASTSKKGAKSTSNSDGDLPFLEGELEGPSDGSNTGIDADGAAGAGAASTSASTESEDASLSRAYALKLGKTDVAITVRALMQHKPLPDGRRCSPTTRAGTMEFRFFPNHDDYSTRAEDWVEDLLAEVAYQLRERARTTAAETPLGEVIFELRKKYVPSTIVDPGALAERADALLESLASAIAAGLAERQPVSEDTVTDDERQELKHYVVRRERAAPSRVSEVIRTGEYPRFLPKQMIPALVKRHPGTVGDNRFFIFPHEGLDETDQRIWIDQVMSALQDAAWLVTENSDEGLSQKEYRTRLLRSSLNLDLLEDWITK